MKKRLVSCFLALTVFFALSNVSFAQSIGAGNLRITKVPVESNTIGLMTLGEVAKASMHAWGDAVPAIQTIVSSDGVVSVLTTYAGTVQIHEFSAEGEYLRSFPVEKGFSDFIVSVGAFARDDGGNYYIFYGKNLKEESKGENNLALVKYSPDGEMMQTLYHTSYDATEKWGFAGVKGPFDAGTCKMEISGDMLFVYFGRTMFQTPDGLNHQSSCGILYDLKTMTEIDAPMPYCSHSFFQYLLPIEGGFISVDRGDAYPRSFMFSKVTGKECVSENAFTFKTGATYQNTFSELGGIAETKDGYIFVGTYEKSEDVSEDRNDSRNILFLTMDKSLQNISDPIWLTDYGDKAKENALYPKIVRVSEHEYFVMWLKRGSSGNVEVNYCFVDGKGSVTRPISKILGASALNGYDTIRYNPVSHLIQWTTENSKRNGLLLYSLDLAAPFLTDADFEGVSDWAKDEMVDAFFYQVVPEELRSDYTKDITRGEFCSIAVKLYERQMGEITSRMSFADTTDENVEKMASLGVVLGSGDGNFNPDASITREQAAIILCRLAEAMGNPIPPSGTTYVPTPPYADASSWAYDAVSRVYDRKIMNGISVKEFGAAGPYTREQSILTILRLMEYLKIK